jgi:hypothetical protein
LIEHRQQKGSSGRLRIAVLVASQRDGQEDALIWEMLEHSLEQIIPTRTPNACRR